MQQRLEESEKVRTRELTGKKSLQEEPTQGKWLYQGECAWYIRGTVKKPTQFSGPSKGKSGLKESQNCGTGMNHGTVVLKFGNTNFKQ